MDSEPKTTAEKESWVELTLNEYITVKIKADSKKQINIIIQLNNCYLF